MLNPEICNISIDANAIDRSGTAADVNIDRFLELVSSNKIRMVIAGGIRAEIQHPQTPPAVKETVLPQIFNLRPGLNTPQEQVRAKIATIIQGNARPETHAADASHIAEALETGCAYFITHDKRILSKPGELQPVIWPSLNILTLQDFLKIYDEFDNPENAEK